MFYFSPTCTFYGKRGDGGYMYGEGLMREREEEYI